MHMHMHRSAFFIGPLMVGITAPTFTLENRRPGWNDVGPSQTTFVYGNPNLRPLIGDWDGDGTETVEVWAGGTFALKNSNGSGFADLTIVSLPIKSGRSPRAGRCRCIPTRGRPRSPSS